ncbi:MAG: SEL1-like repeat protein [Proteobacteria bacterium]|nr:SEL1-like repeat protein [Pseudomonadota bacterium]
MMQEGPQSTQKGYSYWIQALKEQESVENLWGLASCYDEGNQIPINKRQALYIYRKISLMDPNNIDVWVKLAEYYEQGYGINDQPHPEAAQSCYQQAMNIFQNSSVVSGESNLERYTELGTHYLRACDLIKNGKNSFEAVEARILLTRALELETADTCRHFVVKALVNLAYCYQMGIGGEQDRDNANNAYEDALSLDPYCVQALNNTAYYYLQKYKSIITANKDILTANSSNPVNFKDLKEKKKAEDDKKKLINELSGLKKLILERLKVALTISNKAIILCPAILNSVGQLYWEGLIIPKNEQVAIKYFQSAQEIRRSVRPAPFDNTGMLAIYEHIPNYPGVIEALKKEAPKIVQLQSVSIERMIRHQKNNHTTRLSSTPSLQLISKQSDAIRVKLGELRALQAENAKLKEQLDELDPSSTNVDNTAIRRVTFVSDLEEQLVSLKAEVESKQKEVSDLESENNHLKSVLAQVSPSAERKIESAQKDNERTTKRRARKK